MVNKYFRRVRNIDLLQLAIGEWVDNNTVFEVVDYDESRNEYILKVSNGQTFRSNARYFKQDVRWAPVDGVGYKNKKRLVCTK
jgi:hypothetical protein